MQRVLLATDGSSGAGRATIVAAQLAAAFSAELTIMTVSTPADFDEVQANLSHVRENPGDMMEMLRDDVLGRAREKVEAFRVSRVLLHSDWGDPAEMIVEHARQQHADAIVLGRRGLGRLAGLLLGSVSQKVVSLAPCVTIVVP